MAKNHRKNPPAGGQKKKKERARGKSIFSLPEEIRKWIWGVFILVLAMIVALSFFDLAGVAGKAVMTGLTFLIGEAVFLIPLIFVLGGLVFSRRNTKSSWGLRSWGLSF